MDFEPSAKRLQEIVDGDSLRPDESLARENVTVSLLDLKVVLAERENLLVARASMSEAYEREAVNLARQIVELQRQLSAQGG